MAYDYVHLSDEYLLGEAHHSFVGFITNSAGPSASKGNTIFKQRN